MKLASTLLTCLAVGLSGRFAAAETPVKITQSRGPDGSGTSCSSGMLVGWTADLSRGIFLSCGHGYDPYREVAVEHQDGGTVTGEVIAINREFDLSLIAAPLDRAHRILRLSNHPLQEGDPVVLAGFPKGRFQRDETTITGRFCSRHTSTTNWKLYKPDLRCPCPADYLELLVTKAPAPPGLSGGAMLHRGELAGVVIGRITNVGDTGLVVPGETVRKFIRRNLALFHTTTSRPAARAVALTPAHPDHLRASP